MANFNLSQYEKIFFNNTEVPKVYFNGVLVWENTEIDTTVSTINTLGGVLSSGSYRFGFVISRGTSGTATSVVTDWGDGTETTTVMGSSQYSISHDYATNNPQIIKISANGTYKIEVFGVWGGGTSYTYGYVNYVSSLILGDDIIEFPRRVGDASSANVLTNLVSIYIGKNILSLPEYGFGNLSNLITINIDKNAQLNTLHNTLFYNAPNIKKIWLPSSVINIPAEGRSLDSAAFLTASSDFIIYLEGTVQSGFTTYWNSYGALDPTYLLTYYENISYQEYKNL